jgi:hypothetical protein
MVSEHSKDGDITSPYKGVFWHTKRCKWIADTRIVQKFRIEKKYIGSFDCPHKAYKARKEFEARTDHKWELIPYDD